MGTLIRMIAGDGSLVCTVVDSTDMVAELERIHQTSAVVTAGLGRLLTSAAMIGFSLKGTQDSVTLRFAGDGPAGHLIAVSDSAGNPRAYVQNPVVELPLNRHGKLDVAEAVGTAGTLSVIKDVGLPDPAVGTVEIATGEIAEDVTRYFAVSEQTPTVCALGVLVNPDLTVRAAGGYLIQLLPGASTEAIDLLERNLDGVQPVSTMIDHGMSPQQIAERLLLGFNAQVLDQGQPVYLCTCSKQRVERALMSIGRADLLEMAESADPTEVCCHFCDKKYLFSPAELIKLAKG